MAIDAVAPAKHRVEIPGNVPRERVREIDLYSLEGIESGFHEAWGRIQDSDPPDIIWTPFNGGHWIATNRPTINEIYTDPSRFSSRVLFMPKEAGEELDMIPITLDPPEHTPYRKVIDRVLGASQIGKLEAQIRDVASGLIDSFIDRGSCNFTEEYAEIFPIKLFMALANLPMDDVPLLRKLTKMMTSPQGDSPAQKALQLAEGNQGFFDYLAPVIKARAGGDGQDVISLIANDQVDGRPVTFEGALRLTSLVLLGGLDTVLNFLGFTMLFLAEHPTVVAELRGAQRMKLMRGAEEMFRRFPITQQGRIVVMDQEFHGVLLKKDDMVLLPTALGGLDKSANPDPFAVRFDRINPIHSTFGGGAHRCAGMHLARMELIVTLEEWLRRIPEFSLRAGSKPVFSAGVVASVGNIELVWN